MSYGNIEEKLISIVVPVYNVEKYLARCIESLISQTYKKLQIIMVDDGSKDNSLEICRAYEKKDGRIEVYHQENGGVSSARNEALKHVKGEYIVFVDSDDYVDTMYVEKLYRAAYGHKVDIAICGYEKVGGIDLATGKSDNRFPNQKISLRREGFLKREALWFHTLDTNMIGGFLVNKIFSSNIIHDLTFDDSYTIGEDMLYVSTAYMRCAKVYYIPDTLYKYQMNGESAFNAVNKDKSNDNKQKKQCISCMEVNKKIAHITKIHGIKIEEYTAYRQLRSSVWCMFKMIINMPYDRELADRIKKTVRENYNLYRKVNYGSKLQNMVVVALKISPAFVYTVGRIMYELFPKKMYELSRK